MTSPIVIPETFSLGPTHKLIRNDPMLAACYLCGKSEKLNKEHVIPQVMYRPNSIERPIVLRACEQGCNGQAKSLEDQYAAHAFHTSSFAKSSEGLMRQWMEKTVLSGNPNASGMGLVNHIREGLDRRDLKTPEGIVLAEKVPSVMLDGKRIDNFFKTIAKGLTTVETGRIFDWEQYEINVLHEQAYATNHRIRKDLNHPFWTGIRERTFAREWDDFFSFSGQAVPNPENKKEYAAVWSFTVYLSHLAVVIISPKTRKKGQS